MGFAEVADGEGALYALDELAEEDEGIGGGVVADLEGVDVDAVAEVEEEEVAGVGGAVAEV